MSIPTSSTGARFCRRHPTDVGLETGDLGVSADGKHVLVYVGNREWIAADPPRVARWTAGATTNRWFGVPMRFVRWRWLEAKDDEPRGR